MPLFTVSVNLNNPIHTNLPFLYPLKKPENQRFSDFFRGIELNINMK